MVGQLKRLAKDPNYRRGPTGSRVQKDRGGGWYYHRGNGYYSKYDEELDGQLYHRRKKTGNVEKSERFSPHKADYKTRRGRKTPRTNRRNSRVKGYF